MSKNQMAVQNIKLIGIANAQRKSLSQACTALQMPLQQCYHKISSAKGSNSTCWASHHMCDEVYPSREKHYAPVRFPSIFSRASPSQACLAGAVTRTTNAARVAVNVAVTKFTILLLNNALPDTWLTPGPGCPTTCTILSWSIYSSIPYWLFQGFGETNGLPSKRRRIVWEDSEWLGGSLNMSAMSISAQLQETQLSPRPGIFT